MKARWHARLLGRQICSLALICVGLSFGVATPIQAAQPPLTSASSGLFAQSLQADPCAFADVQLGGGGANNLVLVKNRTDNGLTARGMVQINQIPGRSVAPVNCGLASSTCVACQTVSVAMQIDLISRKASFIAPQNVARAQNVACHSCQTVAVALQYVIQVDDPTSVPPEVTRLDQAMNSELRVLETDRSLTLDEAVARIDSVLAEFQDLAASLNDQRSQALDPAPDASTPTPDPAAATPTLDPVTPSPTTAPTLDPATETPMPTQTPDPATATATPTPTPAVGAATATPTPTVGTTASGAGSM